MKPKMNISMHSVKELAISKPRPLETEHGITYTNELRIKCDDSILVLDLFSKDVEVLRTLLEIDHTGNLIKE